MSEATCVFKILEPSVNLPKELIYECGGTNTMLNTLLNYDRPVYGTTNSVDALLMRGGIFIDWSDDAKVAEILSLNVCCTHERNFLVKWKIHPNGNKYNHRKALTCSLPQIVHEQSNRSNGRPCTDKRLNKEETLSFIESTGRFCMVGTGVCVTHLRSIRMGNWNSILFEEDQLGQEIVSNMEDDREERSDENGNDFIDQIDDVQSSDVDDNGSLFSMSAEQEESLYAESVIDPSLPREISAEEEKTEAVRHLCLLYGIRRLNSERNWDDLRPETRRKKITAMTRLHDELYKMCAGDSWKEMKAACLEKVGAVKKDSRVESIMETVGQCLEDSTEKSVRISVLKLLTGIFSEKEIRAGTGASRYLIRVAKLSSFEEIRAVTTSFKRERFNKPKVVLYLRFMARPEILKALPNVCKRVKTGGGNEVSIAAVARMYSYREIHRQFLRYCEELAKLKGLVTPSDVAEFVRANALGFSTAYKFMEVIAPIRQLRMSCCDSFQADAFEAFDEFSLIVDELALLDEIDLETTMDLRRRIRVAKNFIFGEMTSHIVQESEIVSHCWTNALSDKDDIRFDSPCTHSHDKTCIECNEAMLLSTIMKRIVNASHEIAKKNQSHARFRLDRMLQIIAESDGLIRSYRKHLIRCVASEHDRRATIDSLEDGHAMIVADYAMKLLPTDSIERQSQWFAKGGISFHMSATIARIDGELASHEFSHISSVSKQDSAAVAGILEHVFSTLKENGITHVHLRTDNAGNYHSVALIAYLLYLSDEHNITILSHIFSEAQFGKGRADRAISLAKGKLNRYIDSGHSACTPQEIVSGFIHNNLLKGCSYYLIEVAPPSPIRNAALDGVKKFSSFHFESDGVRVRRHDAIGEGMLVKREKLQPFEINSTIHRKEGYTSQFEHFWKPIGSAKNGVEEEVKETESANQEENGTKEYLRCPDLLCTSKFKTENGLDRHVTFGKHKYYKESQSITDYAAEAFSNILETTEEAQMAVHCDSIVPLGSADNSEERKRGWALRNPEIRKIKPEVKNEVEGMIVKQLDMDRRAEAREIKEELRELKNPDGSYRFLIEFCLSESQVKSQITRVVNLRKKTSGGKGVDKDDLDGSKTDNAKRGRKRKEKQIDKTVKSKKVGRPLKKSKEVIEEDEEEEEEEEEETTNEESEDEMGEEKEEELDIIEIMNQVVDENRHAIFDDCDEFEEEL